MTTVAENLPVEKTQDLVISGSRNFVAWLSERNASLAFTTYQAGKVFLIGCKPDGQLSIFERSVERCMGLCSAGSTLWLSSIYQLWRFENALEGGAVHDGYDGVFVPQMS